MLHCYITETTVRFKAWACSQSYADLEITCLSRRGPKCRQYTRSSDSLLRKPRVTSSRDRLFACEQTPGFGVAGVSTRYSRLQSRSSLLISEMAAHITDTVSKYHLQPKEWEIWLPCWRVIWTDKLWERKTIPQLSGSLITCTEFCRF
jgi:hypothetical protein